MKIPTLLLLAAMALTGCTQQRDPHHLEQPVYPLNCAADQGVMLNFPTGKLVCGPHQTAPKPVAFTAAPPTSDGYLSFDVIFTYPLSSGRTLRIHSESRPWLIYPDDLDLVLSFSDELRQADGHWVVFDCDHIADRIIDRALIAEIAPLCAKGHAQATKYWKQRHYEPDEFTDSTGVRWQQVKPGRATTAPTVTCFSTGTSGASITRITSGTQSFTGP